MIVTVGDQTVTCPLAGGDVTVSNYNGILKCPAGYKICQVLQEQCSGNGVLMSDGSCTCSPGFAGRFCDELQCPRNEVTDVVCSSDASGTCDYTTGTCQV